MASSKHRKMMDGPLTIADCMTAPAVIEKLTPLVFTAARDWSRRITITRAERDVIVKAMRALAGGK